MHGRKCRDISSIFWVLGPPTRYQQTIVDRGKNRKISINIGDISLIYRFWPNISESKSVKVSAVQKNAKKNKKKIILADISADIVDISPIY